MIYINQIGRWELGRGETLDEAINNVKKCGFELSVNEIKSHSVIDGDIIYTDEPQIGYNV